MANSTQIVHYDSPPLSTRATTRSLEISLADKWSQQLACKYNTSEIYFKHYRGIFADDGFGIEAHMEPYPDRFLMGRIDNGLVGSVGLYLAECYVMNYGGVTHSDIQKLLEAASVADRYKDAPIREITKLAVREEGKGFGKLLLRYAHSRYFLRADAPEKSVLLVICATKGIFENFWDRLGIRTRFIKPFPDYALHSGYRKAANAMESRLIIPELDIPSEIRNLTLPASVEVETIQ